MTFAHEKLKGLDRDRLMIAVEPVLRAHALVGVEAIWRTDNRGWVLYLTVERPDASEPGAGVTLDVCTELSRDLSAALDVADVIEGAYRLEVGSPGVERKLYQREDYDRFRGKLAKVRCRAKVDGESTLRGLLAGVDEQGRVSIDTDRGVVAIEFDSIESGQLVLDLAAMGLGRGKPKGGIKKRSARAPRASLAGASSAKGSSGNPRRVPREDV